MVSLIQIFTSSVTDPTSLKPTTTSLNDTNLEELLDEIFITSTTTTTTKPTTIPRVQKPSSLVDLIAYLWEYADVTGYVSTSPTTTSASTVTTVTTATRTTPTITSTATTMTATTLASGEDPPSTLSQNPRAKTQQESLGVSSRGFPQKVVIDPHGLDFYFPDVLGKLFGSI